MPHGIIICTMVETMSPHISEERAVLTSSEWMVALSQVSKEGMVSIFTASSVWFWKTSTYVKPQVAIPFNFCTAAHWDEFQNPVRCDDVEFHDLNCLYQKKFL